MKKIVKVIVILVSLALLAGIAAIVMNRIENKDEADSIFLKEEAVYLLANLTEDEDKATLIMDIYNPLKNDTGVTAKEMRDALEILGMESPDSEGFKLDNRWDSYILTQKEFQIVFDSLISELENTGIEKRAVYVFSQDEYSLITNEGEYYASLYQQDMPELVGKVVDVYLKYGSVIACLPDSKDATTLHNVWLAGYEDKKLNVFIDDSLHSFECKLESNKIQTNALADVVISDSYVSEIIVKPDIIEGKVIGVTEEGISIDKYGVLPISDHYRIYNVNGTLNEEVTSNVLMGYQSIDFVVADGVIEAAILTDNIKSKNIRVVINNSDYTSVLQGIVKLTCDTAYTMEYGEEVKEFKAGEEVIITADSHWYSNVNTKKTLTFKPANKDGRIQLLSVERSHGYPSYRGEIDIVLVGKSLAVVNDLPIEEYLCGVLPSEMPSYYPMEALKAQAICARSYAYKALLAGTYAAYSAHLDDSTNSQVYNNAPENEEANYAVQDTYGVVTMYNGRPMSTYFFSTSGGTFCNDVDVWGGEGSKYLTDYMCTFERDKADLSDEDTFRSFIDTDNGYDIIEKDEAFYRWHIEFTMEQITETINENLQSRMQKTPEHFKVWLKGEEPEEESEGSEADDKSDGDESDNGTESDSETNELPKIDTIGTVYNIEVLERGASGIVKKLRITGSEATVEVTGQTNIRTLISPKGVKIYKADGTTTKNFTSLPSPYYYVVKQGKIYTLYGGGFGHGVGMSQNGAKALANFGYTAEEIIKYYFRYAELADIYNYVYIVEDTTEEDSSQEDGEESDDSEDVEESSEE